MERHFGRDILNNAAWQCRYCASQCKLYQHVADRSGDDSTLCSPSQAAEAWEEPRGIENLGSCMSRGEEKFFGARTKAVDRTLSSMVSNDVNKFECHLNYGDGVCDLF